MLGLPVLALEYSVIRDHNGMGEYGGVIYSALALFTVAWVLPHRRSLRMPHILAAGTALVITALPVALLVLLLVLVTG